MRIKTAIALVLLLLFPSSANALENGTIVDNNTRAVPVYIKTNRGITLQICSGFLYSPKVVFTAAHCLEVQRGDDYFVGSPGKPTFSGKLFKVKSSHKHPEYVPTNIPTDFGDTNDFAILIMEGVVSNVAPAILASKETINNLDLAYMASYGLYSEEDRNSRDYSKDKVMLRQAGFKMVPKNEAMKTIRFFMKKWNRSYHPKNLYYVSVSKNGPSFCNGDSGSGFFYKDTYLGIMNWPAGVNNCGMHNFKGIKVLGSFDPVYKFKPFIYGLINRMERLDIV